MARKALSKRTRFEVFKRDGFRCIYCGATPMQSPLHVDHVVAVANGGTNDPSNLVTACDGCNLGKSDVPLDDRKLSVGMVTEAQREQAEQIRDYLAAQREIASAKNAVIEALSNEWQERIGLPPSPQMEARFQKLLEEFGFEKLCEAIGIVARRRIGDGRYYTDERKRDEQVKYFHGVLRSWRNGGR